MGWKHAGARLPALALLRLALCLPDGYGDHGQFMDGCSDTMEAAMDTVKNPQMKATGVLIMKCASLTCMIMPAPTGLVVGGGLLVAGGLMEAFGSDTPEASVQDGIDMVGRNFQRVDLKLDALQSGVTRISQMMEQVQQDVGTLYEDLHLGVGDLRKIDGVYLEFMGRIFAARSDPSVAGDAKAYAEEQADKLSDRVFGVFEPSNIDQYLQRLLLDSERGGGPADASLAALAYQQVLATRLKLFTIQFSASIWKERRDNANARRYAEDLNRQVMGYNEVVQRLGLPVNRTAGYLQSSHYRCTVAAAAGPTLAPNVTACCCGLHCPEGIACGCAESVPLGETAADACGVVTTTTTTTTCSNATGGRCRVFGCRDWRGPSHCIDTECICNPGYCAVDGACSSADCNTDTGGTCHIKGCDVSRGPAECRGGYCMCTDGFCARNGVCLPSGRGLAPAGQLELATWWAGGAFPVLLSALLLVSSAAAAAALLLRGGAPSGRREPLLTGH